MNFFNRETDADLHRFFDRATRAIKRYVIPLARDKKKYLFSYIELIKLNYFFLKVYITNLGTINRAVINVFFAAQVARQKCLRPSAWVCG